MKIGVDLGGSKIEGIVLAATGRELGRLRVKTPGNNYHAILEAIHKLVLDLSHNHAILDEIPVGVGIPGALSNNTGLVKNANTQCLIGKPLKRDLENYLCRRIKLANDADCFTVSEATDGAGRNYRVVFGVILGTGVGGGLAIDGQSWIGPNSITGEWGHNPLPWPFSISKSLDGQDERPGPKCYCGKYGCIETYLSGPGLTMDFSQHFGCSLNAQEIIEASYSGEMKAIEALERYESRLARALASVINIVDPEVIVLGGGLSNLDQLYPNIPRLWQNWVFSDQCNTKLLKNIHGDSSGVRGAAWLW